MAMKGGRKNLKRAVNDETLTLQEGQSIMQVVSLRGNNQSEIYPCLFTLMFGKMNDCSILISYFCIQVIDAKGETTLAIFPAKFQKSMWIKRGLSFTSASVTCLKNETCNHYIFICLY